jgi:integrase
MRDVASGKTAAVVKTEKVRGKAIVEGGLGAAARTVGLLGGILSYAVSDGVIPSNPARGVKRPLGERRQRRLNPDEYRRLGKMLLEGEHEPSQAIDGSWLLALTGCRRGEIANLRWTEVDLANSCLRLADSKEGPSIRPLGAAVIRVLQRIKKQPDSPFVLRGTRGTGPYTAFPRAWRRISSQAGLADVTPHTLRHSFASVANDLGFTLPTVAAMLGHSTGSVTSGYVHHLDSVLVAAADKVAGQIWDFMTSTPGAKMAW